MIKKKKNNKKSHFKVFLSDIFRDLFLASFLFMLLLVQGVVGDYINQLAYTTQVIDKTIYSSSLNPVEIRERIIFNGDRNRKKVALTFDADMTHEMIADLESGNVMSYYDKPLIDILESTKTKATLFLSGLWIRKYSDETRDLSKSNLFELANHTYSHPGFHGECYGLNDVESDEKMRELELTQDLLKNITGEDNFLFRFPGGCYSDADLEMVTRTNQTTVQWDVAGLDGFNSNPESIIRNVVENVQNGSIIVLHMNGYPNEPATAIALPLIISDLRQKGFEFVTVSELMTEKEEKVKFAEYLEVNPAHQNKLAKR